MRVPRLYTEFPLSVGLELPLEARPAKHATQVLRLNTGDAVTLFNGDGRNYEGTLVGAGRDGVRVRIDAVGADEGEPRLEIRLALGIAKGERMELTLQKAVELGVTWLQPLFSARTVVRLEPARRTRRQQHWQGIVVAACEQSGRCRLPTLAEPRTLREWLAQETTVGVKLLLDHRAEQALPSLAAPREPLTLLVGPEGGLTPAERDAAGARGFVGVRLGPRIMRTETAPLAAIAAIQALWGDFRDAEGGTRTARGDPPVHSR
jgi:16S rRNA (uracil1498-N3)-methyltransferase